jgi:hypothetical protein
MSIEREDLEERVCRLERRLNFIASFTKRPNPEYYVSGLSTCDDADWLVPGSRPENQRRSLVMDDGWPENQRDGLVMDKCLIEYEEPTKKSFLQKLFTFF